MTEQWAIWVSTGLMIIALWVILYLIHIQTNLYFKNNDWLNGIRLRLLLSSVLIFVAASPIITNRIIRFFGIDSVFLGNISALAVGICFLGFAISLVSIYHYKKKEDE